MAEELERIYTVPLRNASVAPRHRRAPRAVSEVRHFLARHMKAEEEKIWIDNPVNEIIWGRGTQKPPRRIRVRAIKFEDGVVEVSLPDSESPKRAAMEEEQREAEEKAKAAAEAAAKEAEEAKAAEEAEAKAAAEAEAKEAAATEDAKDASASDAPEAPATEEKESE